MSRWFWEIVYSGLTGIGLAAVLFTLAVIGGAL
jgi:hypothetical protein